MNHKLPKQTPYRFSVKHKGGAVSPLSLNSYSLDAANARAKAACLEDDEIIMTHIGLNKIAEPFKSE